MTAIAQLKEKLQAHALEALLVGLGTILPTWLLLAESHLAPYTSQLDPKTIIRAAALSLVITLWSCAIVVFFRPRLKFESRLGIYRDRKTGLYYCPSCHSKKLRAPLRVSAKGWRCVIKECQLFFHNPNYKESPNPPEPEDRNSWMRY